MNVPRVGLAFLLSQVGAHAAGSFEQRLAPLGLKPQHAGILRMLGSNPGVTQQALAELFGIFPSRMVTLIDELEAKQLLTRMRSPDDRRCFHLNLTVSGKRHLGRIGEITAQLERDLLSSLSEAECSTMVEQLSRIVTQQQITPAVHPAYRTRERRPPKTTRSKE